MQGVCLELRLWPTNRTSALTSCGFSPCLDSCPAWEESTPKLWERGVKDSQNTTWEGHPRHLHCLNHRRAANPQHGLSPEKATSLSSAAISHHLKWLSPPFSAPAHSVLSPTFPWESHFLSHFPVTFIPLLLEKISFTRWMKTFQ